MALEERQPTFEDAITESLNDIDRMLAQVGIPLHMRPMQAATTFIELCVQRVDEVGDGEGVPPGTLTDYATTKWFRVVYQHTQKWYRDRFGDAMDSKSADGREAVILVRDTPYLLKVPMTTREPGTPGESFWLCYHDSVNPEEDVLSWIQRGPVFANLDKKDVKDAHKIAVEIATKLRVAHIALMGMDSSNTKVRELRDAILPNLERAAHHLVKANVESVRLAHWDMQMACELTMKCLAQQRSGTFKETHDLFYLYDKMPSSPPPFARKELSKLPNSEKMTELRYGGGSPIVMREAFRSYRATMTIVAATANAFQKRYQLGKAKFHLKRPPWMEEI